MSGYPMTHPGHFVTNELTLADWTFSLKRSVLREMLAVVSRPDILSFAGGLPAPEMFPTAEFAHAAAKVLSTDPKALQYGPPFEPLKEHIVELMALRGVTCTAEQVFLTTGAQQALSILSRLFLNPGGQVIIEELIYSGIQQAIASRQPRILTVSTDMERGMDVDQVAAHLAAGARPAFIYAIPEAHNPLGVSISPDRQRKLIDLAQDYGVPIVEDDPYGLLRYDTTAAAPLRALDDYWIFYVGSFSKIIAPALRLGWILVPRALQAKLTVIKESFDLETSAFTQRTVAAYLDAGHLPDHLSKLRTAYGQRRNTMLAAMDRYFPVEARWTRPSGGMFVWVELPGYVDVTQVLQVAVAEEKVAFIPGSAFCALSGSTQAPHGAVPAFADRGGNGMSGPTADNCLRLNFSNSTPAQIEDGIARLGRLLHRYC